MSVGTTNRDGGRTSESGHLRAIARAISGEVLKGLDVSQRGAGANMSVDVAVGDAILMRSDDTYGHPSFNDAIANLTITTADLSNPRRDIVILYLDYGVSPSTGVDNNINGVVAFKVVAGTPAATPADPSAAALQAAAGSGNPYIKLGRVRVGTGVTSISNSVIDDLRGLASALSNDGMFGSRLLSFVYASSLSFTVTGVDVTSIYKRGTVIRLYQGGTAKWFIVESSSFSTDTTVDLSSRGLYTLSNVPIDKLTYSYTPDVVGVPAAFMDGWRQLAGMTYASPTTVTVSPADYAAVEIGSKIWLTQTTSKWFYVDAKTGGDTLKLNAGSEYTVANAAITNPYFSNEETPPGHPGKFDWTPNWTGSSSNPSGADFTGSYFLMRGRLVEFEIIQILNGTFGSGSYRWSFPVVPVTPVTDLVHFGTFLATRQAVANWTGGVLVMRSGNTSWFNAGMINVAATYPTYGIDVAHNNPSTWAGSTDIFRLKGSYLAAA